MIYYPDFRVWTSQYEKSQYRIEWLFFEKESTLPLMIQKVPHVGFVVQDIHLAVKGKKILMAPVFYENYYMAFIEAEGIPIELLQFSS